MNQENINELEKVIYSNYSNTAGIIVQKNGIKVYESCFNGYTSDTAFHVFSVSKSIISALIGIAVDKGYAKDRIELIKKTDRTNIRKLSRTNSRLPGRF